jgi:hypothetical protein
MDNLETYLENFSTDGLQKMQLAVLMAVVHEDALPKDIEGHYGTRRYTDWKVWSDVLETELMKRGAKFTKVPW